MSLSRDQTIELLGQARLFAGVEPAGLERIAARMTELDVPADRVIVRQGEIGTGFFIVVSGAVRVVRDGDDPGASSVRAPSSASCRSSIGSRASPRSSAAEPTTCLGLASWDFEAVITEQPSVAMAILRELAGRLRRLTRELAEAQQH